MESIKAWGSLIGLGRTSQSPAANSGSGASPAATGAGIQNRELGSQLARG